MYFGNLKSMMDKVSYLLILLLCCFIFFNNWVSIFLWTLFIPIGFIYLFIELRNQTLRLTKSSIFLLLIFITSLISLIANWDSVVNKEVVSFGRYVFYNKDVTILRLSYWLSAWLIASVVLPSLDLKEKQLRLILYLVLFSVSFTTLVGLVKPITGYYPLSFYQSKSVHATRACGMYVSTMTYAAVITLMSTFFLVLLNIKNNLFSQIRKPLIIALLLSLVGVFYAASLGAMASILGSWIFCFVAPLQIFRFSKNRKPILLAMATLTLYVGIISITMLMPGLKNSPYLGVGPFKYAHYLKYYVFNPTWNTSRLRFSQNKAAAVLAIKNPLFGAGFRNIDEKFPQIKEGYRTGQTKAGVKKGHSIVETKKEKSYISHAHNNYLEILAGMGLFGFVAFCGFFFFWYRESGVNEDIRLITIPIIINFMLMSFAHSTIVDSVYLFPFILIYSISQYVYKKTNQMGPAYD